MKLRPMNGRIVVKPEKPEEEKIGGIVVPDTAREKPAEGRVVAIAEDATVEVAKGDRVIFKQFGGSEIKTDGEKLMLLSADDLVAKYEEKDKIPD